MFKIRKHYDKSYKSDAAKKVVDDNKKIVDVAKDLNLVPQTLHKWVQAYKEDRENAFVGSGNRRIKNKVKSEKDKYIRNLEEENSILKSSRHLSSQPNEIYEFIYKHRGEYRVTQMCHVLGVAKSGYYNWEGRSQSDQERKREYLILQVKQVYIENEAKLGSPKLTEVLNKRGIDVSQKTVSRILREKKPYWKSNYTAYSDDIGLTSSNGNYLSNATDVVLNFPRKDCVLQKDTKGNEEFLNRVLAKEEISKLLSPKVLSNVKKYDRNGEHEVNKFNDTDNLIIKGNNLIALYTLKERFKKKIKLIYIDPPYNTGVYHLKYNDYFSHSTWLTFMKNRLEVAKELLRKDGAIYIHCDDNEQAYLKVLCDEIFGRENFVTQIVWKRTSSQQNTGQIAQVKDYILIFANNKRQYQLNKIPLSINAYKAYKYADENGEYRIDKMRDKARGYYTYDVHTEGGKKITGPWVYKEMDFIRLNKAGMIHWSKSKNGNPYKKVYLKKDIKQVPNDFWGTEYGTNQQGSSEIINLFGERVFDYPKPELLMYHLIKMGSNKNDIVLDFFMGSATTQAVAHKLKRQYIGVEQMDYIHDVSVARLKKVIRGEQGGISKKVGWQGGGSFVYAELDELT